MKHLIAVCKGNKAVSRVVWGQNETLYASLVCRVPVISQMQVKICIELANLFSNMSTKLLAYPATTSYK